MQYSCRGIGGFRNYEAKADVAWEIHDWPPDVFFFSNYVIATAGGLLFDWRFEWQI